MVRALVIGANGFIGSHLVDAMCDAGYDVTAFDRFSNGKRTFAATSVTEFIGDFLNRGDIEKAVKGQDFVFHFLSTTTPATAQSDPSLDIRTNVEPTVQLLEACVDAGVQRFFYASTGGAIYGNQGLESYSELDMPLPVSPYAIGKLTVENYLRYFHATHDLSSVALRISNPYGSGQALHKKQGLIPIAIRRILNAQPVVQMGDGSMVRDFIYIDDLIAMILKIAAHTPNWPIYNLGSGRAASVAEVIAAVGRATNRPVELDIQPAPATFVRKVVLDISRYIEEFGAVSFSTLDEGILRTLEGSGENIGK
ncbi:NAD-dependent epimerase/dehydratase family protein [Alpinimonas psychrophila]|uniref:UDP-glucose 4-epimerase n=1 Tax=Alpinimonas psychrophila TaxID=748908 RepID=A0A7W3JU56_9MICO|nr:UDP-glucose 4-epimerase [Alpinimonas psychrophila]